MQKLSEEAKKNKNAYIMQYSKTNQKKLGITMNLKEFEEFKKMYDKLENKTSYKTLIFQGLTEELKKNKKEE